MSSCISPWPCRPVPMTPRSIVSLGGVWAIVRGGRMAGAIRVTLAALRKSRRVIPVGGFVRGIVRSFASTYHYDERTVNAEGGQILRRQYSGIDTLPHDR